MRGALRPILTALMIGLIAAGLVLVWLNRPKGPADITREYLEAQQRGDAKAILELTASSSKKLQTELAEEITEVIRPLDFSVGNQYVEDNRATIYVVVTRKGSYLGYQLPTGEIERKEEVLLVREDGAWRVDTYATAEKTLNKLGELGEFYKAKLAPYKPKP